MEVYGKTQSQQVRESALSVNALDVKPVINSLNSLNELVNRASGVKIREEGGVGSDFDLSINGLSGNSVRYFRQKRKVSWTLLIASVPSIHIVPT